MGDSVAILEIHDLASEQLDLLSLARTMEMLNKMTETAKMTDKGVQEILEEDVVETDKVVVDLDSEVVAPNMKFDKTNPPQLFQQNVDNDQMIKKI